MLLLVLVLVLVLALAVGAWPLAVAGFPHSTLRSCRFDSKNVTRD